MSTTRESKDATAEPIYVEVLPGIVVPDRISRGYGFVEAGGGYLGVEIEVVEARPCLRSLTIRFGHPPPLDELADISLEQFGCSLSETARIARSVFADAVQSELLRSSGASMTSGALEEFDIEPGEGDVILDQRRYDGARRRAMESTVRRGGRPRISDEQKLAILAAYEAALRAGQRSAQAIKPAMEVSKVGERQTRKHIEAARRLREQDR